MAQRRMFSLQIVDTDAFLDMPQSSQLLYFHLAMRADDDGFVGNPKKIMRVVGNNDDDFRVLLSKRFLIAFESGVVVIKHWKIHNYIAADRYHETKYVEEKSQISEKDNGSYTECIQAVDKMETQVRLGKVRLGKASIDKQCRGEFGQVRLSEEEYAKLCEQLPQHAVDALITELDQYIESTGKKYKSHYATIQAWARRKINEHAKGLKAPNVYTV